MSTRRMHDDPHTPHSRTGPARWGLPEADPRFTSPERRRDPSSPPTPDQAAAVLLEQLEALAQDTAERWLATWQQAGSGDLTEVRAHAVEDGRDHLRELASAVSTRRAALFCDYLEWRASRYGARALSPADAHTYLSALRQTIVARLDTELAAAACIVLDRGSRRLEDPRASWASFLPTDAPLAQLAARYLDALLAGDTTDALRLVRRALDDGAEPLELYLDVFQPVLREVGRLWQLGRATVAQEHQVTHVTEQAMAELSGRLAPTPRGDRRVVISCVGGEQHEVGARIVNDLFALDGWHTHFLGADCPPVDLAALAADRGADLVAVSATLTTHLPRVHDVLGAVRERGAIPVLVGGRPFNLVPDLWRVVGADGTAPDARGAVAVANAMITSRRN